MGHPQFDHPTAPNYTTVEASNGAVLHVEYDMKRNVRITQFDGHLIGSSPITIFNPDED